MLHLFQFSFPSSPALPFNFRYLDTQFFCIHLVFVLAWLLTDLRITVAFVPLLGVLVSSMTSAQLSKAGLQGEPAAAEPAKLVPSCPARGAVNSSRGGPKG